jgi:hypothetical protein
VTLDRATELLRTLHALERVCAVISRHGTDPDWQDAVSVLSDRVFLLRACLSLEDPAMLDSAREVLDAERVTAGEWTPHVGPPSLRVH